MAQLGQTNHKPTNRLPKPAGDASVNELARDFATELIRWRANMQPEAVVKEAFALARAFANEAKSQDTEIKGESQEQ